MKTKLKDMEIKKVVFKDETETSIFCEVHILVKEKVKTGWFRTKIVSFCVVDLFRYDKFWLKKPSIGSAYNCRTNEEYRKGLGELIAFAYKIKGEVSLKSWVY